MNNPGESADSVRLDVWLWAARFYKTRSLAKHAIESSKVEVAGQTAKPSRALRVGDELQIRRGDEIFQIQIVLLSEKRGSAKLAQGLYLESAQSRARRDTEREKRKMENAGYQAPQHKPDKRARKLIRALGDIDAL